MWVQSLGQEDPLEEGTATTLDSRLEKPMNRAAWQIAAHRVAESRT